MADWSQVDFSRFKVRIEGSERARKKREDELERERIRESGELPGLREKLASIGQNFVGEAQNIVAGVPATAAARVLEFATTQPHQAVATPEAESVPLGTKHGARIVAPTGRMVQEAAPHPEWAENAIGVLDAYADETNETSMRGDPRLEGSLLYDAVPRGLASVAAIAASGGAAGAIGAPAELVGATGGALMEASGTYLEAKTRLAAKVARGEITPEQARQRAWSAWALGLPLGATDQISVGGIMGRVDKAMGGLLGDAATKIALGAVGEFAQEAGQGVGENVVQRWITGDDVALLENVKEQGLAGGIVGGALAAMLGLGHAIGNRRAQEAQQVPRGTEGAPTEQAPGLPTADTDPQQGLSAPGPGPAPSYGPDLVPGVGDPNTERVGQAAGQPDLLASPETDNAAAQQDPTVQRFVQNLATVGEHRGRPLDPEQASALLLSATPLRGVAGDLARAFGAQAFSVGQKGTPLELEGQYLPETRTVVLDASLDEKTAARQVIAHELWGHHGRQIAEAEWTSIRDGLEADFPELMDQWRVEQERIQGSAGVETTPDLVREESVAQAAEEAAGFTVWALSNRSRLETLLTQARKGDRPTFMSRLLDLFRRAFHAVGIGKGTAQQQLDLLARSVSAGQWESMNPRQAAELAGRFVKLADAMVAAASQPRHNGDTAAGTPVGEVGPTSAQRVPSMAEALTEDVAAGRAESEAAVSELEREAEGLPEEITGGTYQEPGVAQMPTEPGLFGPVEREAKQPAAAAEPTGQQLNLLDVQEGDLPGQTSILDPLESGAAESAEKSPKSSGAPIPESIQAVAETMKRRRSTKALRFLDALRVVTGTPAEAEIQLEQVPIAQLRKALYTADPNGPRNRSGADLRRRASEFLQRAYLDTADAIGRQEPTEADKQRQSAQRSQAASKRLESRRARVADGLEGDFRSFVRALGGLANPEGHFDAYTSKEQGKRGGLFGGSPIAFPKGSDKGTSYEEIRDAAVEVGYFPGVGMADVGLQDILDALDSNPVAPGKLGEQADLEAQRHYERELAAEQAYYDALSPEERAQADAFMAERAKQAEEGEPFADRFSPRTESRAFTEWFRDSKVTNEDGSPKVVYHGTSAVFGPIFRPGLSEIGTHVGSQEQAAFVTHSGEPHEGYPERVYPLFARIERPLRLQDMGTWDWHRVGPQLVKLGLMTQAEFDNSQSYGPLRTNSQGERTREKETVAEAIERLGFDGVVYLNRSEGSIPHIEARERLGGISSLDAVSDKDFAKAVPEAADSWIALHPGQLKSALGNFGTFDASDPDIRFSPADEEPAIGPHALGGSFADREETFWQRLNRRVMYEFAPVARAQKGVLQEGGTVTPESDVAQKQTLYESKRAEDVRAIRQEQRKLVRLLKRAGIKLDEFDDYLRALHAPRRNDLMAERHPGAFDPLYNPGSGSTALGARLTPNVIRDILSTVEADPRAAAFKQGAALVHAVNAQALKQRVDRGILSDAGAETWREQFGPEYVPLRSAELESTDGLPFVQGSGFQVPKRLSKRAEGRKTASGSPTVWSFAQAEEVASWARRNEVGLAMAQLVRANPIEGLWRVSDTPTTEDGKPVEASDGKAAAFRFKERGDDRYIVFEGPTGVQLSETMKRLGVEKTGSLVKYLGGVGRVFTQLATSWNPEFLLRNLVKDVPTALVRTVAVQGWKAGARTGASIPMAIRGIRQVLQAESAGKEPPHGYWQDRFVEFRRAGGKTGYTSLQDYQSRAEDFGKALERGNAAELARFVWSSYENLQEAVEAGTRLAVYDTSLRHGMSQEDAAVQARTVTVDFNRKGELTPVLNALYWFFNPSVQGSRMVLKTLGTPNGAALGAGIAALGYLLAHFNRWIGQDDDENRNRWDETSDWIKNGYLQVLLPGMVEVPMPGGRKLSIDRVMAPLPWGYNMLFSAGLHAAETQARAESPSAAAGHVLAAAAESFNPMGASPTPAQFVSPSLIDPFVQLTENRSFTGSLIRPENPFGQKSPSEVFWPDVNEQARALTHWLNEATGGNKREPGDISVSPENLEHLVQSYTGGGGQFLLRTFKTAQDIVGGGDVGVREIPFARSFVSEPDERAMQSQYRRAINRIRTTDQVQRLDQGTPQRPELLELVDTAKEFEKEIEALEEAGETEQANARRREFLKLYRSTLNPEPVR